MKTEISEVQPARKTNSKEVKQAVQSYILQAIDFTGYEVESTLANALKYYKSESGPIRGRETVQEHFIDFLMGLPSWFNIEYCNWDILQLMKSWGLPLPVNKTEEEGIKLFHYLIFREFNNLLQKEGLSIY